MRDKLRALIAQLRLHGMADALDTELARAEREATDRVARELLAPVLDEHLLRTRDVVGEDEP